jgi:hypothetical protein
MKLVKNSCKVLKGVSQFLGRIEGGARKGSYNGRQTFVVHSPSCAYVKR